MLDIILAQPAVWGFLGAFIYSAPRFSACYWQCRENAKGWGRCAFDAVVSVMVGFIAAIIASVWVSELLHRTTAHDLRVIAALIGLLVNRLAPKMVDGAEALLSKKWPGATP